MNLSGLSGWRYHVPGRWVTYQAFPRLDSMPRFAGVYAIYINGELVYVGSSMDVGNRLSAHNLRYGYGKNIITPWGDYAATSRIEIKVRRSRAYGDWAMWELRLIRRLKPVHNRRGVGRKAA